MNGCVVLSLEKHGTRNRRVTANGEAHRAGDIILNTKAVSSKVFFTKYLGTQIWVLLSVKYVMKYVKIQKVPLNCQCMFAAPLQSTNL